MIDFIKFVYQMNIFLIQQQQLKQWLKKLELKTSTADSVLSSRVESMSWDINPHLDHSEMETLNSSFSPTIAQPSVKQKLSTMPYSPKQELCSTQVTIFLWELPAENIIAAQPWPSSMLEIPISSTNDCIQTYHSILYKICFFFNFMFIKTQRTQYIYFQQDFMIFFYNIKRAVLMLNPQLNIVYSYYQQFDKCSFMIFQLMKLQIATLIVLILLASVGNQTDQGTVRINTLRKRSLESSNRIINFSKADFQEYAMKYPRPYDIVIYFTAKSCKLCTELYPQYEYMVDLYEGFGAIDSESYPTFFVAITYTAEISHIYKEFGFSTAPNLVVSKPHMAVVNEAERKLYLQSFKWSISHTDGHVTTHKMLEFTNKRTGKEVFYKPTFLTMCKMFFGFIALALIGVLAYTKLSHLWNNWVFWLVASLIIYVTCCSGIIYDIIHDVPFTGRDQKTGETVIFSGGNREQYGLQGWIVSISITMVGMLFIGIIAIGERFNQKISGLAGVLAIVVIFFVVTQLQKAYKEKGWYGPNFYPPGDYLTGPLSSDQGNNI